MKEPTDTDCPCGHDGYSGEYRCLNGKIYGPCNDPSCYGVCADMYGNCKSMNGCCDSEDD